MAKPTFPPSRKADDGEGGKIVKPWPPVIDGDLTYWHETPHIGSKPKPLVGLTKAAKPVQLKVGFNRWRFSLNGLVVVRVERQVRKLNPDTRKFERVDLFFMESADDGRKLALDPDTWQRLSPANTTVPGYGNVYVKKLDAEERHRSCSRCGKVCQYAPGTAHSVGRFRQRNVLHPLEWAEIHAVLKERPADEMLGGVIRDFAKDNTKRARRVYTLCSSCIPEAYMYCSHCRMVHKKWHHAEILIPYRDMLSQMLACTIPSVMVERSYHGSGRDKPIMVRTEHLDDRVVKVVELIGRATVCPKPDQNISDNLMTYMLEFGRLYDTWQSYREFYDGQEELEENEVEE